MKKNKHVFIASLIGALLCVVSLFAMLPITSTSNTSNGIEWMKNIDDSTPISTMSIPGSHDSGALHSIADLSGKCQDLSITQQLNAGARFFDIRLELRNNNLKVVHGIVDQKLDFSTVLKDFSTFLNSHPSEGLIVSIKEENSSKNSSISFDEALKKALNDYSSIWLLDSKMPSSLGDLRGKISLLSRYKDCSIGIPSYDGWLDPESEATSNTFDIETSNLHIQDYYKVNDISIKQSEIINCFEYSQTNTDKLTLNFSSCYFLSDFPPTYALNTAKIINKWLVEEINNRNNLGIIISDFLTSDYCEAIYQRN